MDENKLSSNAFIGETCVTLKTLNSRPVQRFKRLLSEQSDVSYPVPSTFFCRSHLCSFWKVLLHVWFYDINLHTDWSLNYF